MGIVDDLKLARTAFERRDWATAYERLSGAEDLSPPDVASLATAAFLVGDIDTSVRVLQRGYHDAVGIGDDLAAVRFAFWLAMVLQLRGEAAVAAGWVARAERLLENHPEDVVEHGYVEAAQTYLHIVRADFPAAMQAATRVVEIGRRHGDADLIAHGLMGQGRLLCHAGQVPQGLHLLDEAMVGIAAGEVSPVFSGMVYCSLIEACQEVSDYHRAAVWTHALTRWVESQPALVPFTGQCAVHRGQILRLHGAFAEALEEFELAGRRYADEGQPGAEALALVERGDVLRLQGRYAEAEDAFTRAADLGLEPQPGLALLWLARGRIPSAVAAIRRLLLETQAEVPRSKVLPAAVEILVAAGELEEARTLAEELQRMADAFGCIGVTASACTSAALVAEAAGEVEEALRRARAAHVHWSGIGCRFEAARARLILARAMLRLGDQDSAVAELRTAGSTFDELGATPQGLEVQRLLPGAAPAGLSAREVEVLRLVAAGHSNPQIAATLVISEKTVARHLSNIFTKLDVTSRTAAAAFAFQEGLL